jgi:hypothetical protein
MRKLVRCGILVVAAAFFCSCGNKAEKQFKAARDRYCVSMDEKDRIHACERLFEYSRLRRFPPEAIGDFGAVYDARDEATNFFWPREVEVEHEKKIAVFSFDAESGCSAFALKNEIFLYNSSGRKISQTNIPVESDIIAMNHTKNGLYVIAGGFLFVRSADGNVSKVLDENFVTVPTTGSFVRALMIQSGNVLAINCGHAGMYHLSVCNLESKNIFFKNIKNASFRFALWNDSIVYVTGGAGNWEIMHAECKSKKVSTIRRISDVHDIAFAGKYAAIMHEKNNSFCDLETASLFSFPLSFEVKGSVDTAFLLARGNGTYLIKAESLIEGLRSLEECPKK